ncbi:hypothetical protein BpHYR1_014593 [Brachionus plicatilis]|uniref:Uncharacterized protein n=1 Tax=Brachionus plicatilis TaxID=10195 RepID=A0A3M7PUZ9_BRAPC|nr:hypothetical protein BpHYR1_014593 [Brachionus plicatilis]
MAYICVQNTVGAVSTSVWLSGAVVHWQHFFNINLELGVLVFVVSVSELDPRVRCLSDPAVVVLVAPSTCVCLLVHSEFGPLFPRVQFGAQIGRAVRARLGLTGVEHRLHCLGLHGL